MGSRTTALVVAAGTAVAAAVVVGGGANGPGGPLGEEVAAPAGVLAQLAGAPDGSVLAAGLVAPTDCDDLLAGLQHLGAATGAGWTAVDRLATQSPTAAEDSGGGADPASGSAAPVGAGGTNVQEAGVDEPDLVERVGDLLVTGTGGVVRVLDVDGPTPVELGSLEVAPWGDLGLLAVGPERVVALGHADVGVAASRAAGDARVLPGFQQRVTVTLLDLGDPTAPREVSRLEVDGSLVQARAVDGVLRLATRSAPPVVDPWAGGAPVDDAELQQRLDAGWASTTLEDWLPTVTTVTPDGSSTSSALVPCERVGVPTSFAGLGTLTLSTLDATGDALAIDDSEAVVAGGEVLYATPDRVVVATSAWGEPLPVPQPLAQPDVAADGLVEVDPPVGTSMPWPAPGATHTDLHVFDTDGTLVTHVASGRVDGRLVDQFALSIHDGVLRTATTTGGWDGPTQSSVVALRVEGTGLVEVGRVDGLGPDEDIQSVRFLGATGYVVTFRRTDPLYVVDLADPTAPRVLGELKIEGFSSYLHPLAGGRLLGIGQDADPTTGVTRGLQVSTFDVSAPTAPTRDDVHVTPEAWSEAEHDHHALLVGADGLVGVPFEQWRPDGTSRLGALLFRVGGDGTLQELGALDVGQRWEQRPRRVLVAGDRLVTVADGGVTTWDAAALVPTGSAVFPVR